MRFLNVIFSLQLPPPANDSYQLIGVNQDQFKGNYIVRTKQYQQSSRFLSPQSSNAVQVTFLLSLLLKIFHLYKIDYFLLKAW